MKKAVLFACLVLLMAGPLYAAGNCTIATAYEGSNNQIQSVTWVCTTDASAGTVPSTFASGTVRGWVYNVDITVSGSVPPTSSGAMTLIGSDSSNDVMGGNCTVGTTTSRCVPGKSGWVSGTLTPGFGSTNFGTSKIFTVKAWVWRQN